MTQTCSDTPTSARLASLSLVAVLLSAAFLVGVAPVTAVQAQTSNELGIAAVVNDDVISEFDLNARIRLLMLASQIRPTEDAIERMRPQALRSLIDERLRLQEAEHLGIEITDEEVDAQIEQLAGNNNLTLQQFSQVLNQAGVPLANLQNQYRGEIAWSRIVQARLRRRVDITEEEVDAAIDQLRADVGGTEVQLSEIFLSVDSPQSEASVRSLADRIVQQLASGVPFATLARQFSESPSSQQGGDMGWVLTDRLDPGLKRAVEGLQPGQYSQPVRGAEGLHILQLRDQRASELLDLSAGGDEAELVLKQLVLPLPDQAGQAQVQAEMQRASRLRGIIKTCSDIDFVHDQVGVSQSGDLGRYRASELPQEVRQLVGNLQAGQTTAPFRVSTGVTLLMVCEREVIKADSGLRQEIRTRLLSERLDSLARRYMRDLRRAAVIDNRLGS